MRDKAEIEAILAEYFDGLYHGDVARLKRVFHPQAIYACATDGELTHMNMPDYFAMVEKREAPASRNEARRDEIISIEFAGPVTAAVRARCAIGPKHFTDLLGLVKLGGEWRILSKVFHYDLV